MSKTALIPIANNIEEVEAITIIDVLRRAGANVTVASIAELSITSSHGVKITADDLLKNCENKTYDLIAIPGGMPGANYLRDDVLLKNMLIEQKKSGRWFAAICASPAIVLNAHGLLNNLKATCYPSMLNQLPTDVQSRDRVVVSKNCITSQGVGTALAFALKLVACLFNSTIAQKLAAELVA